MKRIASPLLLLLFLACAPGGGGNNLNVLLVTIDTLRSDAIGTLGNPSAHTSCIDKLASEGILFSAARTAVPITLPVHSSLFTGLYPATHGVRHNGRFLPDHFETLAEQLSGAGYQTAAFIGSLVLSSTYRIGQGFDIYDDRFANADGSSVGLHGILERPADLVVNSFEKWFAMREKDHPFFVWTHFYDPHAPYTPPEPLQEGLADPYGGEVLFSDRQVGRLLDLLDEAGLTDNTVVMVLSDHGEGLGEHDESEHGLLLYETTLAVPWIIRIPGRFHGRVVYSPVHTIDFRPTLCELLELPVDKSWQGRSLLPLIAGEETDDPDLPLYAESYYGKIGYHWAPLYSIRSGPWKLVEGARSELFHLGDDPQELNDRSVTDRNELNRLRHLLEIAREAQPEAEATGDEPSLTTGQKEALEALGYVTPGKVSKRKEKLDPRDVHQAHELILEGRDEYLRENYERAEQIFFEVLKIDPENVPTLLRLSDCYKMMERTAEEESLYVRILSIDGENATAWCNLGVLFERRGEFDRAMDCYERSADSDSTFALAHLNRGNVLLTRNEWREAGESFRSALRFSPGLAGAHFGLARIFQQDDNLDSLVYQLKLAIRFDPNMKRASNWLEELRRANTTGGTDDGIGGY